MIVAEGLDSTGKTTLVEKIVGRYPSLKYRPSIGNKHDPPQIARQAQDEAYAWDMLKSTVGDRSRILSEYIYAPLLKNRPVAYPYHAWLEMLGTFSQHEHLIIHCVRSKALIIDSWKEEDQLKGVRQHLDEIQYRYESLMDMLHFLFKLNETRSRIMVYNFQNTSDTQVFLEVERYMERTGL